MSNPESVPGVVAIANYDFRASGTVAKSIQIAAASRSAGLPVELWCARARGPLLARVPAGLAVVEFAPSRVSSGLRPLDLLLALPALARVVRQRRPAVLLSGGNHLHLAARAGLALSGMRPDVRLGLRVSNSSRHGAGPRRHGSPGPLAWMKYAGADFLAAVSGDLAAEVRAQVPDLDVECIPNGCDVTSLRQLMREPAPHCPPDHGGILITAMGRLARQKGFDVLIRALAILRREVDAQLVIIGSGSSTQLAGLTRLAAKQGVAGHVHFAGYLANPFALIARSQMFVCASRWEGSCNALLEALACEVPVVATDCPTGNAEMLLGGQLGELALPGCAASLADAMHRELQTKRSAAGRERQLARLDIARCLEQWTALLAREYQLAGVRGAQPQRA